MRNLISQTRRVFIYFRRPTTSNMIPRLPATVATLPSQLHAQQRHWLCFGLYRGAVMRRNHQTTCHI